MADIEKLREEFQPYYDAHTSYFYTKDGKVEESLPSGVCYYRFTQKRAGKIDRLFLFFGGGRIEKYGKENSFNWCKWVINDSFWADAFITKCPAEGLNKGFEVDTSCERVLMNAGCIILRHPFEFKGMWDWPKFMEMGFDEYESFALSLNFNIDEDIMYPHTYNSNHKVITPGQKFGLYKGEDYVPKESIGTLAEGCNGNASSSTIENWGCLSKPKHAPSFYKRPQFTKENCEEFLNKLKGI